MKITAIPYYLSSLKSIVVGFRNWYAIPLLLLLHPLPFTIKNRGTYYADNLMDVWTLKEVLLDDCYQLNNKQYSSVIDIGGAIGDFSILTAGGAKKVVSCEYDMNRLQLLKYNIHLSQRKNITVIPKKISTLDSLVPSYLKTCDLLKLDCEGSEYAILMNSKPASMKKIKAIVGELHFFTDKMKEDFIQLKRRLKTQGFTLKTWENPVHNTICYFSATR